MANGSGSPAGETEIHEGRGGGSGLGDTYRREGPSKGGGGGDLPYSESPWGPPPGQGGDQGGDGGETEYIIPEVPGGGGDLINQVLQELRSVVGGWAQDAGWSRNAGQAFVNQMKSGLIRHWGNTMGSTYVRAAHQSPGNDAFETFNVMLNLGLQYLGARLPFEMPEGGGGGGRRGGGGGGRRGGGGPTAADIRKSFDIEQLANTANSLSRTYLIQDLDDPQRLARSYVDAVIADPDQKLDYKTFVERQLKKDPRWNIIFKNLPNGMDEAMYIQRYVQQAAAVLGGGDEATQRAFEGAALGAGAEAFSQRLAKSRAVRSSSKYVNRMEDRLRGVADILV